MSEDYFLFQISVVFFFVVLGFELRAYTWTNSTNYFFVMGFFETGSCELFAGFELLLSE
jgi:hypothetical protein